jgi:hypothetical protein
MVFIGIVTRVQQNNGEIFVKVQNGFELDELHNVQITSTPSDNTVLAYETSTSLYKMKSIPALLGYTPTTNARTLTINGTSYDLSADRSWSVGTHTGNLTTGYVPKATGATTLTDSIIYDNGSGIGINTTSPYDSANFKLDVNGGVIIKNTSGTLAQLILINSNPATGGNNGFVQFTAGGNTATAFAELQSYYGLSVASGALRLQPAGGQVLIGTRTASAFTTDINGTLRVSGQLTLGSTISNNTYVYTMPGASGTLALVSQIPSLSGYVPTSRTLTINGTSFDLSADRSWSITAGVSSVQAGSGISVSTSGGVATVSNTGLLSGTAGSGISVSTSGQNLNIVNTGLLSGTAGSGISVSTSGQNLNIVNTGLLSATAGSGISVSTSSQNVNIVNTGLLSATAGTGISVSTTSGTLNIVNTITNTNQLTNGAGYITGINSSMVTSALGYTPYNSSNPSGYISSYTETDTLASVTARGATTSTTLTTTVDSSSAAIVAQNNGTGARWYGRIGSFNSSSDRSAFIATYASVAVVGAHNNALTAWAPLYVNTVDGTNGGQVYLPTTSYMGGNIILHAGNYNSYSPTLTGSGASGTWGISISGASASATDALRIRYNDGPRNLSDRLPNTLIRTVFWDFVTSGTVGGTGNYAGVMTYAPWDGTSASTGDSSYQLAFLNESGINGSGLPGLRLRKGIDTTWGTWYSFLHAGNYTSYSPTLTGGGASGTWGINITGNAATVGGVQLDNIVWGNARGTNDSVTTDNDSLDKTGYYTSSGFTNRPFGVANWMYIEHIKLYNNNALYQKQIGYDTYDDRMWVRTESGGTWSSWKQIWTSDSLTNLNQLTNGPGYITGYTETDTLATVMARGSSTASGITFTAPGGSILMKHAVAEVDAWIFQENAANWGLYYKNNPSGHHAFGGYTTVGAETFGMSAANVSGNGVLTSNFVGATSAYAQWMLSNYTGYIWSASTIFAAGDMRAPQFRFTNSGNSAFMTGDAGWGARIQTDSGYILFGPANGSYAHIYTDRGNFYFNKDILINGTQVVVNSGTWGINITGGSGSVSGLTLNNLNSPINPDNVTQNQLGYNTSVNLFGQTDGGLYSSAYSSNWIHQIYGDFRSGQIAIRGKQSGTWQAWRTVLDSGNYTSYALPVNGNWIGNTGMNDQRLFLRTNGDLNHYLWNAADDWEELNAYEGTGFRITSNMGSTGVLYVYGSSNGGYTYSPYSFRAPIFYDSQDTNYYVDPNSESSLYRFTAASMTRNAINYLSINSPFTTRAAQTRPYQNGTMGWGTTDFNTVFSNWGSGFIDSWSSPANSPDNGIATHWVGFQSLHYNHENNTNGYGFQMVYGGGAGHRYFWRNAWASLSGWVEMIHTGNIGSQSVSYANSAGSVSWGNVSGRPTALSQFTNDSGYITSGATVAGLNTTFLGNGSTNIDSGYSRVIRNENSNGGNPTYAPVLHLAASDTMWQISAGHAGQTNLVWRSGYAGTWSTPWWTVWHSGNDGAGSGLDADLLDGYHASNFLGFQGNSYYQVQNWLQLNGVYGLYAPSVNGAHWLPNTASTYTTWRIAGSRNGYSGIHDDYSNLQMLMFDGSGNGGTYREANGLWYWYYHLGNNCMGIGTSTTSSSYKLYVNGTIYATGDVIAYSDRRKKTNIETIGNALEKVTSLRGVFYDKIGEEERGRQLGVIAQEVDEVLPEAVSYAKDIDEYGVKYGNLGGLFIEAFKEQQRQIEELKSIIDGLTK